MKWMVKRNKKIHRKYKYDPEVPMKIEFYNFQKAGINFGAKVIKKYKSFMLCDEQGLGKTPQALGISYKLKKVKRILVVCPGPARGEWQRIINEYTRSSYTTVFDKACLESRARFTIVNYDRLRSIIAKGWKKKFDLIIADEFHNIKNKETVRAKSFNMLRAKYYLYLSGTPILNRLEELWVVLHKIDPKEFNDYYAFVKKYSKIKMVRIKIRRGRRYYYTYVRKYYGGKNIEELQSKIMHYFLRRRKKEVMKELPEKIYQNIFVTMKTKQRKMYDRLVRGLKIKIDNKKIRVRSAMAEFVRARQICGTLATLGEKDCSASLDALEEFAKDHLYGEHKFFIVSPYKIVARCAVARLKKLKIKCVVVDGDVSDADSEKAKRLFQNNSKYKVYAGTIAKNKESLTLTAGDYVIFIGKDLVQKLNEQTEDRIHRIDKIRNKGRKSVNIVSITNRDSVEESIEEKILLPKAQLFAEMFDGVKSEKLTLTQIRNLL